MEKALAAAYNHNISVTNTHILSRADLRRCGNARVAFAVIIVLGEIPIDAWPSRKIPHSIDTKENSISRYLRKFSLRFNNLFFLRNLSLSQFYTKFKNRLDTYLLPQCISWHLIRHSTLVEHSHLVIILPVDQWNKANGLAKRYFDARRERTKD